MKNLSVIEGGNHVLPRVRADAVETRSRNSPPDADPTLTSEPSPVRNDERPSALAVRREDHAPIESVVKELQAALDALEGPRREVQLQFDGHGDYVVEIRSITDGKVIQRFPPENLLNLQGSVADLLGTVVDRLS
jgi:uncharacterized FlaG/YvyC family protein